MIDVLFFQQFPQDRIHKENRARAYIQTRRADNSSTVLKRRLFNTYQYYSKLYVLMYETVFLSSLDILATRKEAEPY